MKLIQQLALSLLAIGALTACSTSTTTSQQLVDRQVVAEATQTIGSAQPLPPLTFSTQRQVMIESYLNMAIPNKPMYMIATNPGAGDGGQIPIIAYAVVKGCVPSTYQLTRPTDIADYSTSGWVAILEQAEINSMYTGNSSATYCIGMDGTFFSIEHPTSFSSKPFSEVLRSRAAVDFTPNLDTKDDGSVVNTETNEVLYMPGNEPIQIVEGIKIDLNTNQITYDQEAIKLLEDTEQQSDKINTGKRPGR